MYRILLFVLLVVLPASAETSFKLKLPVDCELGKTCWISNLPFHKKGDKLVDYTCGDKTYPDHKGTDFALRDEKALADGVRVLAAAKGKVKATRDNQPDISVKERGRNTINGVECGNGLVISHGGGWETQYCHLKKGSISVKVGQEVEAGETIGEIGLSGMTEYPHMHLSVRHKGQPVDPFLGEGKNCGQNSTSLWDQEVANHTYRTGIVYNYGVCSEKPDFKKARAGDYRALEIAHDGQVLIVWADIFAVDKGDEVKLQIIDAEGKEITSHTNQFKKYQARYFLFTGKRTPPSKWTAGTYKLKITYKNSGQDKPKVYEKEFHVKDLS